VLSKQNNKKSFTTDTEISLNGIAKLSTVQLQYCTPGDKESEPSEKKVQEKTFKVKFLFILHILTDGPPFFLADRSQPHEHGEDSSFCISELRVFRLEWSIFIHNIHLLGGGGTEN
jgi:hypothetical protein